VKLTSEMIRAAANGIDAISEIAYRAHTTRSGRECAAITLDANDLIRFGMSLAYVVIQHADPEYTLDGGEVDLIDDALSEFPRPVVESSGEIDPTVVAYWPAVPFETEES
jgi:hypothetical protein